MKRRISAAEQRLRKPRTAAQQAADVIEHVLATDSEDYLETAQHTYAWWQLALLDVYAVLLCLAVAALSLVLVAIWSISQAILTLLGMRKHKNKVA